MLSLHPRESWELEDGFFIFFGALCANCVLSCSSIVPATDQLSLVAIYPQPVGADENKVGARVRMLVNFRLS